jgi:hypothetical protein
MSPVAMFRSWGKSLLKKVSLSRRLDLPEGAYIFTRYISPKDIIIARPEGSLDIFVIINVLRTRKAVPRLTEPIL